MVLVLMLAVVAAAVPSINGNAFMPSGSSGANSGDGLVEITFPSALPTIACPTDISVPNDPGQCSAEISYQVTASSDNNVVSITCNGMTRTFSPPQSAVTIMETMTFQVGTTTVTCNALDAAGNSSSCSFMVIVFDTEPPIIQCPENIISFNDFRTNGAIIEFSPVFSDNCPGFTAVCTPPSGSFFPPGTTTVICRAMDASGNVSICTFNVTILVNPCRFFNRGC